MWASGIKELAAGSVVVLVTVAGVLAQGAGERPNVATGLWETTLTSHMSGAELPTAMPPHTTRFRSCATKENIEETFLSAQQQQQGSCSKSNVKMSSGGFSADFTCRDSMHGHVEVVFSSDTEAQITMHAEGDVNGRPIEADSTSTARRVSPNCGSVQPGETQAVR